MLKIVCVSDLHSVSFKEIYERINNYYSLDGKVDYIIVMGDYTDSYIYDMKGKIQVERLREVINIAKKDKRIKMILGNHDAHYLYGKTKYFSKNVQYEKEIKKLFEKNIKMFNYAIEIGGYIFSHQGITKTLLRECKCKDINGLNKLLHKKKYDMFIVDNGLLDWFLKSGDKRTYYDDYERLMKDKIKGKQVVGHYTNRGICLNGDILAIENVNHGNLVTIYV